MNLLCPWNISGTSTASIQKFETSVINGELEVDLLLPTWRADFNFFLASGMTNQHSKIQSKNHRIFEVGRYLWQSSGPVPVLKQGHPEQDAYDHGQMILRDLQGGRLYNLPGQLV